MTKVKVCGLMESGHVKTAVEAGVDAIGFVFAPSRRRITLDKAIELASLVPSNVLKIGVFVDATAEEIKRVYESVPLDYIQYHGNESQEFIGKIGLPSIKVLSVYSNEDIKRAEKYEVDFILFDTPGKEFKGGSGETFDWHLLEDVGVPLNKLILAGGLNPGNVSEAIQRVKPYMVDVSSGVEIDNRKDDDLIRAFVSAVKNEER
ncbi:phosphoribosylanthranilate isomerase [Sporosarcina siberiensis]|uniref:N-(5'-phosphoribosyl)anthranilate isomerase n=1 Tax=Sporosarcina siberiensis TaxID=1365606 RepID=A0ABW4SJC9_9BACL